MCNKFPLPSINPILSLTPVESDTTIAPWGASQDGGLGPTTGCSGQAVGSKKNSFSCGTCEGIPSIGDNKSAGFEDDVAIPLGELGLLFNNDLISGAF